ncbi:MAG: 2TM domain-containing protein [Proteobacteria bacterium]|nr:2TM domain-containing protein [Pseudomonadota bacterium]
MEHPLDEQYEKALLEARGRVRKKTVFYKHLLLYLFVNMVIVTINLLAFPERLWFSWPILGWGAGLAAHGFRALGTGARAPRVGPPRRPYSRAGKGSSS